MLVVHDRFGRCSLRRQPLLQPSQSRGCSRILIPQPVDELDYEGGRKRGLACMAGNRGIGLRRIPVDPQQPVRHGIRFLACGTTAYDACRGTAQILDQHDPQRDRDRPQLTDGQRLNALIGAHELAQRFRIETAVGMGNKSPGQAEHARIAIEGPAGKLGQQPIESRREVLAHLADLIFDEVVVIDQPFGSGGDRAAVGHRRDDGAICREQGRLIVPEPHAERAAGRSAPGDLLCGREACRVLLETLDAEELCAQQLAIVPGRIGRTPPQDARHERTQFDRASTRRHAACRITSASRLASALSPQTRSTLSVKRFQVVVAMSSGMILSLCDTV